MRIHEVKVGMICALEEEGQRSSFRYYGGAHENLDKLEESVQRVEVLEIVKVTEKGRDLFSERQVRRVKVRLSRPRRPRPWYAEDRMDPVERELREVDDTAIVEAGELLGEWAKFEEMLRRARVEQAAAQSKKEAFDAKLLEINAICKRRGLPELFPEFEQDMPGDTIVKGVRCPHEWRSQSWTIDVLLALVKGEEADASVIEQWLFEQREE